jgi:hypothetical protein
VRIGKKDLVTAEIMNKDTSKHEVQKWTVAINQPEQRERWMEKMNSSINASRKFVI